jgi:hypothetical protein
MGSNSQLGESGLFEKKSDENVIERALPVDEIS